MFRILRKTIIVVLALLFCTVSFYYMLPRNSPEFVANSKTHKTICKNKILSNKFRDITDELLLNSDIFKVKLQKEDVEELNDSMLWMYTIYFFYTDSTCCCCQKLAVSVAELGLKYGTTHVRIVGIPLSEKALEEDKFFNIFYTPEKAFIEKFQSILHWVQPLPGVCLQDNYSGDVVFATRSAENFPTLEKRISQYFEWSSRITEKRFKNIQNKRKIVDKIDNELLLNYKKLKNGTVVDSVQSNGK